MPVLRPKHGEISDNAQKRKTNLLDRPFQTDFALNFRVSCVDTPIGYK